MGEAERLIPTVHMHLDQSAEVVIPMKDCAYANVMSTGPTAGPSVRRTPPMMSSENMHMGPKERSIVRRPSRSTRGTARINMAMLVSLQSISDLMTRWVWPVVRGRQSSQERITQASHIEEVTRVGGDDWYADCHLPVPR